MFLPVPPGARPDPETSGPRLSAPWFCQAFICQYGGYLLRAGNRKTFETVELGSDRYAVAADEIHRRVKAVSGN